MPALLGSLAGLLLAGLAEEKSGSMQVVTMMEANDANLNVDVEGFFLRVEQAIPSRDMLPAL